MNWCLAGPHSRSEKEIKLLPLPVFELRIVHFVVPTLYGLRCPGSHYVSRSDINRLITEQSIWQNADLRQDSHMNKKEQNTASTNMASRVETML